MSFTSSGRPLPNQQIRIINDSGERARPDSVGEIAIHSDCLFTGYYNRPDLTAQAFVDGWYCTGDLGFLLDGELYVVGRKKDLLIVGGENIYPQDIEEIVGTHPSIHDGRVIAMGVYNPDLGTQDIVVVCGGGTCGTAQRHCRTGAADSKQRRCWSWDCREVNHSETAKMDCEEHRRKSGEVGNERETDTGTSGIRKQELARTILGGRFVCQGSVQCMSSEAHEMIEHILQLIRKPGATIDENTPLVSSGLIDSMALVDVLVKLEDLTHRRIPAGKVQPKDMDTVAKMFATAERVGKPRGS